ncbi:uncharacterized protein G2W53_041081 [Senna tora]|uniref:Uncharacterized protein n=1 Tax=Senna tora TaxID=362788 RepID=A0A834SD76_9FABA|nr:uncharacterized protein G2W53_041081 [Senna tora]
MGSPPVRGPYTLTILSISKSEVWHVHAFDEFLPTKIPHRRTTYGV